MVAQSPLLVLFVLTHFEISSNLKIKFAADRSVQNTAVPNLELAQNKAKPVCDAASAGVIDKSAGSFRRMFVPCVDVDQPARILCNAYKHS